MGRPCGDAAGLNGSGKSSIFDAITFALFGHHRGGSQEAHELINKDTDKASVTFEFTIDGKPFQIVRTIQYQAAKRPGQSASQPGVDRQPLGADSRHQYEGRVRRVDSAKHRLELRDLYFLRAVAPGTAEKLLDSTAKGRFEVLAGIVDLERYRHLHEQADEERKHLDDRLKEMRGQLAALPEVSPIDLLEAEGDIAAAETAKQGAAEQVEHWQQLEFQARQWADLQARLQVAQTLAGSPAVARGCGCHQTRCGPVGGTAAGVAEDAGGAGATRSHSGSGTQDRRLAETQGKNRTPICWPTTRP